MRLEDLYPNFFCLSEAEQLEFVSSYRKRRAIDLVPTLIKRDISKVDISLSPEEETVRKLLKLTKRDFMQLKLLANKPEEEEEL